MSTKLPFQKKGGPRQRFSGAKRFGFGDDEDHEEEDQISMVTGFDDNKVQELTPKQEEKPLTIAPLPNVDWRAKKKQLYIPSGQHAPEMEKDQKPEILDQSTQSFGLQVMKKNDGEAGESSRESTAEIHMETEHLTVSGDHTTEEKETPKTLEELALEAVIKDARKAVDGENGNDQPANQVVIPMADETEAFREDVRARPEDATMEDYERVPVDQFGAALLRGLGWKEGEGIGRNRKNAPTPKAFEPVKRQALLGLGAKPEQVNNEKKKRNRRSGYEYKETSLFKKVAKRKKMEEQLDSDGGSSDYASSNSANNSRKEHRSNSDSSSRRRSRSRDRQDRRDRDRYYSSSNRDRSRDRSRSRERRRRRKAIHQEEAEDEN
ncbi:hypothetical protein INT45_005170 [Circinella minor]|uniref:G-patch domain-containing protein n=1 Tax=Circinella minor TaxID=1195481 RepID=A0A8H7S4W9_9FUNG|nr:hypothetical protein INT45_005170 [Circinella minor]